MNIRTFRTEDNHGPVPNGTTVQIVPSAELGVELGTNMFIVRTLIGDMTFIASGDNLSRVETMNPYMLHAVYLDESGNTHTQPLEDITEVGTLIDPDTGDDMEILYIIRVV